MKFSQGIPGVIRLVRSSSSAALSMAVLVVSSCPPAWLVHPQWRTAFVLTITDGRARKIATRALFGDVFAGQAFRSDHH